MAHSNNVGQQAVPTRWPGAKGTHTIHSITEIPTQLEASHTSSCHSDRISASTPSVTRSQVMLPSSADNCRNERTMGTGAVGDGLDLGSDGPPPPDGGVDMRPDPIRGGQASMQVAECTPRSSPLDPDVESSELLALPGIIVAPHPAPAGPTNFSVVKQASPGAAPNVLVSAPSIIMTDGPSHRLACDDGTRNETSSSEKGSGRTSSSSCVTSTTAGPVTPQRNSPYVPARNSTSPAGPQGVFLPAFPFRSKHGSTSSIEYASLRPPPTPPLQSRRFAPGSPVHSPERRPAPLMSSPSGQPHLTSFHTDLYGLIEIPRFKKRDLNLGIVRKDGSWLPLAWGMLWASSVGQTLFGVFFDVNVMYTLVQISQYPAYGTNTHQVWTFATIAYALCWATSFFIVWLGWEVGYEFWRKWSPHRPAIEPIYRSLPASLHLSLWSFDHFTFLTHIRLSALGTPHAMDILPETAHLIVQTVPGYLPLAARTAIVIAVLISFWDPEALVPGGNVVSAHRDPHFFLASSPGELAPYAKGVLLTFVVTVGVRTLLIFVSAIILWIYTLHPFGLGLAQEPGSPVTPTRDPASWNTPAKTWKEENELQCAWRDRARARIQNAFELCIIRSTPRTPEKKHEEPMTPTTPSHSLGPYATPVALPAHQTMNTAQNGALGPIWEESPQPPVRSPVPHSESYSPTLSPVVHRATTRHDQQDIIHGLGLCPSIAGVVAGASQMAEQCRERSLFSTEASSTTTASLPRALHLSNGTDLIETSGSGVVPSGNMHLAETSFVSRLQEPVTCRQLAGVILEEDKGNTDKVHCPSADQLEEPVESVVMSQTSPTSPISPHHSESSEEPVDFRRFPDDEATPPPRFRRPRTPMPPKPVTLTSSEAESDEEIEEIPARPAAPPSPEPKVKPRPKSKTDYVANARMYQRASEAMRPENKKDTFYEPKPKDWTWRFDDKRFRGNESRRPWRPNGDPWILEQWRTADDVDRMLLVASPAELTAGEEDSNDAANVILTNMFIESGSMTQIEAYASYWKDYRGGTSIGEAIRMGVRFWSLREPPVTATVEELDDTPEPSPTATSSTGSVPSVTVADMATWRRSVLEPAARREDPTTLRESVSDEVEEPLNTGLPTEDLTDMLDELPPGRYEFAELTDMGIIDDAKDMVELAPPHRPPLPVPGWYTFAELREMGFTSVDIGNAMGPRLGPHISTAASTPSPPPHQDDSPQTPPAPAVELFSQPTEACTSESRKRYTTTLDSAASGHEHITPLGLPMSQPASPTLPTAAPTSPVVSATAIGLRTSSLVPVPPEFGAVLFEVEPSSSSPDSSSSSPPSPPPLHQRTLSGGSGTGLPPLLELPEALNTTPVPLNFSALADSPTDHEHEQTLTDTLSRGRTISSSTSGTSSAQHRAHHLSGLDFFIHPDELPHPRTSHAGDASHAVLASPVLAAAFSQQLHSATTPIESVFSAPTRSYLSSPARSPTGASANVGLGVPRASSPGPNVAAFQTALATLTKNSVANGPQSSGTATPIPAHNRNGSATAAAQARFSRELQWADHRHSGEVQSLRMGLADLPCDQHQRHSGEVSSVRRTGDGLDDDHWSFHRASGEFVRDRRGEGDMPTPRDGRASMSSTMDAERE